MIVLDASLVVELLLGGPCAELIRDALTEHSDSLAVPHLLDVEVTSALKKLAAARLLDTHARQQAIAALVRMPVERYAHTPLLSRMWELRHSFTAYDAAYVALAEFTNSTLYTTDSKLARGHRARVRLFCRNPQ